MMAVSCNTNIFLCVLLCANAGESTAVASGGFHVPGAMEGMSANAELNLSAPNGVAMGKAKAVAIDVLGRRLRFI